MVIEATTLEAIAAASGISRRTFFYYLKSKDDVLLAHESGDIPQVLRPTLLKQSPDQSPIDAARKTFLALASRYDDQTVPSRRPNPAIDRKRCGFAKRRWSFSWKKCWLRRCTNYGRIEARRPALRLAAMMAMGTLRFAKENWRQENAAQPLTHYIGEAFDLLDLL